ncbi:hypothetical protein CHLNCDRAFT_141504 [Chlorella variabilis]|uniref:U-box domain-containing protein n=1 Tax=Chlorella variabilis TaxID=554065 RepID=E1ZT02_CHLVA|nr:hypothetical protein CHLNCDRAFT_141504 [Chlorella variabilis]EFN51028.1 hypothetical protein CHLNCDRAFT_141504 [Chlorella variabilis]|eukprot:XP_005843130.1 hypothetical protein CHLNCDRAFT_141504 [Chlorella variabilis]
MVLQDHQGLTPRMRAIKQNQLGAAKVLLKLEQQHAGRRQSGAPSSRAPHQEQEEAQGTALASLAAAEAAADAAAAKLLAEEELQEQQAGRQAAKAAKRQRQKERQRQRAAVPAGEAGESAAGQAAQTGHQNKEQRQRLEAAAVPMTAPSWRYCCSSWGELLCPITQEPLQDPVVAADGNLYERAAIKAWIARQKAAGQAPCSPLTNLPLEHLMLTPVRALRSLVAGAQAAGLLE